MEEILRNFAEKYSLNADKKIFMEDAQRNSNNPMLFLFIGDSVKEASLHIRDHIKDNWDNGEGIAFMNVLSEKVEDKDNTFNFQFEYNKEDIKHLRKNIRDKFYNDKKILQNLNSKITTVRDRILCLGNLFNSFENISIVVVTESDEELNVILPEITMLIKKRMMEVFKLGLTDLYILIKERDIKDEFFSQAMSISFFREIEYVQKNEFYFKEKIDVYGEERELFVEEKGPIFYLTYILEEKNEKGLIPDNSQKNNYDIITYINLLKNRNVSVETYSDTENQYYDNTRFKNNLNSENLVNRYVTAGLALVKRPNTAIAITVLRAFYESFIRKLKEFSQKDKTFIIDKMQLDESRINSKVEELMPKGVTIEDMNSVMMSDSISVEKKLSKLTLRQVEEGLYSDRCEKFFNANFKEYVSFKFNEMALEKEMKDLFENNILDNHELGLYCAFNWSSEDSVVIKYISDQKRSFEKLIDKLNSEIEDIYESRFVEGFSFKNIFNRGNRIEQAKKKIFIDIYGRKLEILKLKILDGIMEKYQWTILNIHKDISFNIEETHSIYKIIKEFESEIIKEQHGYTGQNIDIYYTKIVNNILGSLEDKKGKAFYFKDKYLGNLSKFLEKGRENFVLKITEFCMEYILTKEEFNKSFEDELDERSNVDVTDLNKRVLSKEELYRKLYDILEYNSSIKAYIMNYDVKSYQEKYFFGDYSSEFIRYAFEVDRKVRNYKIGYIHERRISGIEKLNLMGGFGAKDIFYIRNSLDKYKECLKNGYELHGMNIKELPEII